MTFWARTGGLENERQRLSFLNSTTFQICSRHYILSTSTAPFGNLWMATANVLFWPSDVEGLDW